MSVHTVTNQFCDEIHKTTNFLIYFLFLFLKDIYKRLIYLNLQRFGHCSGVRSDGNDFLSMLCRIDIVSSCEGTGEDAPLNFLISFHQIAGEQDFRCSTLFQILFTCNLVEGDQKVKRRIFTCALTRRHDVKSCTTLIDY